MHGNLELILTLTCGLTAALAFGYVTQRLGLSPIVGYLLAGIAVGPSTPGFVANRELAEQMAEVGVILLMFGVGLHFHFRELLAVRSIAVPGAVGQIAVATLLGALAAWTFGWGWAAGLVFGLALSVASTVVLTRVLVDNNDLHTPVGHIAVGWLIVEDLFTVAVLVVLPALFGGNDAGGLVRAVAWSLVKIVALVVVDDYSRRPSNSMAPRARGRHALARTLHARRPGRRFGYRGWLRGLVRRIDGRRARFWPAWWSANRISACEPRRTLCRCATLSPFSFSFPWACCSTSRNCGRTHWPRHRHAGHRHHRQTARRACHRPLARLPGSGGAGRRRRPGSDRRVLVHSRGMGRSLGILPPVAMNALVGAAIISIAINPVLYRSVDSLEGLDARPRLWRRLNARLRMHSTGDSTANAGDALDLSIAIAPSS